MGHVVKRAIDITVAAVVLLLAVPLLAVLAAVVRLSSPGPALFRQVRVGRRGRPFRILKLRTMVTDAEARLRDDPELLDAYMANHFKLPPDVDPRLTAVGKLLRRTSLDELPQLFNVLRGEMSLVGVRPVVPGELDLYGDAIVLYEHFKPGITGYWQVQGRSGVAGADRIELDRFYFENWNVWLDLKILVRTVPAVFRCSGAH
ncbi:MAG: sugar transferase [Acidimicrobiales bacterium]